MMGISGNQNSPPANIIASQIAVVVGDQYDDVVASLQHVREILCLLALYDKDEPSPDLVEVLMLALFRVCIP